jgi:hypothetical protein
MATDTQAMGLLIRMMPLMLREFAMRIEPSQFFADSGYADAILSTASQAQEPRLQTYAQQLRTRLAELGKGPPGAVRSAASTSLSRPAAEPLEPTSKQSDADSKTPAKKYTRSLR